VTSGLLFPRASDKSLAAAHGREDITTHGFRSTFRDWAADLTTFPREVAEMAMSHKCIGDTEAAYFRSDLLDRRRELMNAWAAFCLTPWKEPAEGDNVVELRRA
jgi:integrase